MVIIVGNAQGDPRSNVGGVFFKILHSANISKWYP